MCSLNLSSLGRFSIRGQNFICPIGTAQPDPFLLLLFIFSRIQPWGNWCFSIVISTASENFVLKWRIWKEGCVFWGHKTRCTKMADYNTGGIRWWKNSNLKVEVIHHFFSFLALGQRKTQSQFYFPHIHICAPAVSTCLASFYYLVYFFLMLNFITLKILYFSFFNMFYHFIYNVWDSGIMQILKDFRLSYSKPVQIWAGSFLIHSFFNIH